MRPRWYVDDGLISRPATWSDVLAVMFVWFLAVLGSIVLLVGVCCLAGKC